MEELPDKNIFMMCPILNRDALSELPTGYHIRSCRRDELGIWMDMPFDQPEEAIEYRGFMEEFFQTTYGDQEDLFFEQTRFVCDAEDRPIATCLIWKAYGEFNTIHWLKVLKGYEGHGIGRALLSMLLLELSSEDFPVYLHTQPESFRAIKLYSDFGFQLLSDPVIGGRENHLEASLPYLKEQLPAKDFADLQFNTAPKHFLEKLLLQDTIQF